ncbi:MAG: putative Ig domain-containing protein [Nanoarchaeota archaeon]|nr:putative Ig domain-containing protein [Nanoarchaeota archaeon]
MKSKSLLLVSGIFLVFMLNSVSAVVVYGEWQGGSQSVQVNRGDSVTFTTNFFSLNPSMTINIKLYTSSGTLVHTFENNRVVNSNSFSQTYTITEAMYETEGNYELILSSSDRFPSSDSHTLTLQVLPPANNAPVITSTPITQVNENSNYAYDVNAIDADNDPLTYSLTQAPSWLSINSQTGLISGTAPSVSANTQFNVAVRVSDGEDSDTQSYTITVRDTTTGNTKPVANSQSVTTNMNTPKTIVLTGFDSDGFIEFCDVVVNPAHGTLSGFSNDGCQVTYTPSNNYTGSDSFRFTVTDDDGAESTAATVSITVNPVTPGNNPPVVTSTPVTQVNEGANYVYQVVASDADGDTLSYSITTSASWLTINTTTGLVSGTAPSVSADTQFNVAVRVSDGTANVTQTYVLTVRNVPSGGGGGRATPGGTGVRFIPSSNFEEQKYLEQFGPRTGISAEETPVVKKSISLSWLWWLLGLLLLVLILVALLSRLTKG